VPEAADLTAKAPRVPAPGPADSGKARSGRARLLKRAAAGLVLAVLLAFGIRALVGPSPGPSGSSGAGDEPWRGFLSDWARPLGAGAGGKGMDPATGFPRRIRRTRDGSEMALIPAGMFPMGAVPGDETATSDEKPRHEVTLTRPYYMDIAEVTVRQWRLYRGSVGGTPEGEPVPSDE